ncbi:MAG: hypothetical protein AAF410_03200 [Pseudomonadota bacterium]
MALIAVKIPKKIQMLFFSLIGLSWATGLAFFALKTWFIVEGEFGPEKHPWQQPMLMIHGGSSFLIMMMFGALLVSHVPSTWKLNRLRGIGITLVSIISFQVISAYMLYYLGNETMRDIIEYMHLFVGFILPFIILQHVLAGKKKKVAAINKS